MKGRRTEITILCDDVDISKEINRTLLGFNISNSTNELDSLEIDLANINNFWIDSYRPYKGLKLEITYKLINWTGEITTNINVGTYYIDSVSYNGPPDVCRIRALTVPTESKLLDQNESSDWLNTDLETIASEIAKENNLELKYLVGYKREYVRVEQKLESQFNFLKRICSPIGVMIKIFDGKLILFEESVLENAEAEISFTRKDILSYSLADSDADTYAGCELTYYNAREDKVQRVTFYTKNRSGYKKNTERLLKIQVNETPKGETEVEIKDSLMVLAEKYLKARNEKAVTGKITILGKEDKLYELTTFNLIGFGDFDGKYLIKKIDTNYLDYTLDIEFIKIEEVEGETVNEKDMEIISKWESIFENSVKVKKEELIERELTGEVIE